MNAAVFMLTSAFCAADAPAPAAMPAPAPAPVVSTGSACGGGCAPAVEACDPCAKTKFLDKIKGKFSSISFPKLGHSHGCDSCAAPAPACEPCAKPAPVVCVKPAAIIAAPACSECSTCGHAKVSIFDKIKSRMSCHKAAEPTCDTCGTVAAAPAAAPCAGAVTTVPSAAPAAVTPPAPATPKAMPNEAPKAPVVPVPAKVGFGNGPTITPVSSSSVSPF